MYLKHVVNKSSYHDNVHTSISGTAVLQHFLGRGGAYMFLGISDIINIGHVFSYYALSEFNTLHCCPSYWNVFQAWWKPTALCSVCWGQHDHWIKWMFHHNINEHSENVKWWDRAKMYQWVLKTNIKTKYGDQYGEFTYWSYQVQVGMKRSTELHVLYNVGPLSLIWSDYSNLLWLDSSTKETGGNLLHIGSFSPVKQNMFRGLSFDGNYFHA